MDDALADMMDREVGAVRARYAELTSYYRRLLRERGERDEQFRKRRLQSKNAPAPFRTK
jgi:hypothetical protein